jgi:hypothetical protein
VRRHPTYVLPYVILALLVPASTLVLPACDFTGEEGCFSYASLNPLDRNSTGEDKSYTLELRIRVEVSDGTSPVGEVGVGIEHWKVHCDGSHSQHRRFQGETAPGGVYSTELATVYPTFNIDNDRDAVVVDLLAWKDGWEHREQRRFPHSELKNLPAPRTDAFGRPQRRLVVEFELTYDPQ